MDLLQNDPKVYENAQKSEMLLAKVSGAGAAKELDSLEHSNDGAGVLTLVGLEADHEVLFILKQDGSAVAFTVSGDDIVIADLELADGDKIMILMKHDA